MQMVMAVVNISQRTFATNDRTTILRLRTNPKTNRIEIQGYMNIIRLFKI